MAWRVVFVDPSGKLTRDGAELRRMPSKRPQKDWGELELGTNVVADPTRSEKLRYSDPWWRT